MLKIAILDYGHGGSDPGAVKGIHVEKIYNLDTGKSVKVDLERNGWLVFETRCGDESVSLNDRCVIANEVARKYPGAYIVFVSIHHNAGGGDRAEAIYSIYEGEGKEVAIEVANALNRELGQTIKTYSKKGSNNKDYFAVIRGTTMPAIIVEVAFLDNVQDVEICDTYEERVRNGKIIASGIIKSEGSTNVDQPRPQEPVETPKPQPQGDDWVRRLQAECNRQGFSNQVVDGIPGPNTLKGCPLLEWGAKGNITKLLQEKLVSLGYSTNGVDGIFGNGTRNAVVKFQKEKGLASDGIVGKNTWSKLIY